MKSWIIHGPATQLAPKIAAQLGMTHTKQWDGHPTTFEPEDTLHLISTLPSSLPTPSTPVMSTERAVRLLIDHDHA